MALGLPSGISPRPRCGSPSANRIRSLKISKDISTFHSEISRLFSGRYPDFPRVQPDIYYETHKP
jgi:hypothetical protein